MSDHFNVHSRVLEVLLHKAAVDEAFKAKLLEEREAAARELGLELSPMEAALLAQIPQAQLEWVIARTEVPKESRKIFMGQVAAAMLAVLGIGATGCLHPKATQGEPEQIAGPAQPVTQISEDQIERLKYANVKGIDPLKVPSRKETEGKSIQRISMKQEFLGGLCISASLRENLAENTIN